jgi:hypothetical protein
MHHMKLNLGRLKSFKNQENDLVILSFFSHGGHLFAVTDSNIIQIISPIYIKVLHRLNHGQTVGKNFVLISIMNLFRLLCRLNKLHGTKMILHFIHNHPIVLLYGV